MENLLSFDKLTYFVVLVFPGLLSIQVYRLLMPAKPIDWSNALLEGLFYSLTNCFSGNLDVFRFFSIGLRLLLFWNLTI